MRSKISIIILLFAAITFYGQQNDNNDVERKIYTAIRIDQTPKIDGIPDEEVWQNAPVANGFTERNPNNGTPQPEEYKTTVKVLYDDTAIYFATQQNYPDNSFIYKEMMERDNIGNDDVIGITINGYNDRQQSLMFIVQASGVQADAKIFINANDDYTWDGIWYSAVKMNEKGWSAEIKIPFSELRFPKNDVQEWGINFFSQIQKLQTQFTWNYVDNKKANYLYYDGILKGIENLKTPTRLSFLPYFSAYANNYDGENSYNFNGGMDLKYGINDAFTLDMTLIPDFGQASFDKAVLNLGPFEQQYEENRSFFTEGTELFNKGELFYSRRVGGSPSRSVNLSDNEELIENPEKVKLFNAVKISGRTNKGLGIGFFNGVTEKMKATIIDQSTGEIREEVTEPWANYNVFVLDQRFSGNSSVSLVNTNVTRDGSFRDANVTAVLADVRDKSNMYNFFGHFKESIINDGEMSYGSEGKLGAGKIAGEHQFNANINFRTKDYNIDDLGYTGGNNYINYFTNYSYQYLKPRGNFNNLKYNLRVDLTNRLEPSLYSNFGIHQQLTVTNRKFQNYGIGLWVQPFGRKDIYEARTFGRHLNVGAMVNPWLIYNTDKRKRFTAGGYTEVYFYNQEGRTRYVSDLTFKYRFSDRFSTEYKMEYDIHKNDVGFAGKDQSNIYMGRRNVNSFENSLSAKYIFNDKMALNLNFRHYFSDVEYLKFYTLNEDGNLTDYANFTENRNGTYNFWNIDLRYSWWFAPGSNLTLLFRNAVDSHLSEARQSFKDNFNYMFGRPMLNNLSLKITYYLDYNRVKKLWN